MILETTKPPIPSQVMPLNGIVPVILLTKEIMNGDWDWNS